tara:strand:+ start:23458 stop:24069 length:612 start_codon:yes stop_codon:yes gene_type:complete
MLKPFSKYDIYGLLGLLRLISYYTKTKILFPSARLIRFPIEIRGKKYIDFGLNLTTGKGCRIEAFPFYSKNIIVKFGNNVEINDYVHIAGITSVNIGNNVLIASKVFISDIQHGCYSGEGLIHSSPYLSPNDRPLSAKPVIIEDNVWIGESVSVIAGVTIGKGSIIGANSVVSKSLPPNIIAVGSPAKPIKEYNFDTQRWEKI